MTHSPEQNRKKAEAMRESQDHAMRNVTGELSARNAMIHKFHNEGDDISKSSVDVNRMEQIKKEGKNPSDYGYDEKMGFRG